MASITDATSAAATAAAGSSSSTAAAKLDEDYQMFLQLLVTQMQNQDPLDPMDSSQYTQQLVQFSQVEQAIKQTQALEDILASLGTADMLQAAGLVGREASFDTDVAGLSATAPATWDYALDATAATGTARVLDSSGRTVATIALPNDSAGRISWDGTGSNGSAQPAGAYTLVIDATAADGSAIGSAVRSVGTIRDATLEDGATTLNVNGIRLPLSALVQVGAAA